MNESFEAYLKVVSPDDDALVQAARYYIADVTDFKPLDEMEADLERAVDAEALRDALQRLQSDPAALAAASRAFLAWAWSDENGPERVRRAVAAAKRKLSVIDTTILAMVAMYGMFLYVTDGRKRVIQSTTLADGTVTEVETEYYPAALSSLVDLIEVETAGTAPNDQSLLSATSTAKAADDPQVELLKDPRNVLLWFATNREPVDHANVQQGFSGRRSKNQTVRYGRCIVNVPQGHELGSTGTGGLTGWWQRWRHGTDDRLRVLAVKPFAEPDFWRAVRAQMLNARNERTPEVLLFVHGFRVSFEDAALRAAQLAYDLKIRDTAFFSWASAGKAAKYPADEDSARNSTRPLAEFISRLDADAYAAGKALHVIAHSMGNRVLLAALQWLVDKGRTPKSIDKIVCAAPDEDSGLFVQAMVDLRSVGSRRTLYASSKDKPVWLSEVLHGAYGRAGLIPPVTIAEGLDTVDASGLEATFLGHSDFATERPLLADLFGLIKTSLGPNERLGLERAMTGAGAEYWRIK